MNPKLVLFNFAATPTGLKKGRQPSRLAVLGGMSLP